MQMPCVNVIDCEGVDSPVANLSAEAPDQLLYFGRFYGTTCVGTCTSIISQEAADLCAATVSCEDIQLYYSIAASAACPDDESITYSVAAGAFIALSQEAADALAQSFVDAAVLLMCDGSPEPDIFYSTAQSCEASCSNGTVTYTTLNQLFVALSQAEADALALAHACQVAELICENGTDINESRDESPGYPVSSAFNAAQTCAVACPDGGTFSYTVPRGTFRSSTQAQANAMAYSYACVQAVIQRFCLGSGIPDRMCVDSAETFPISVSGIVPDEETWSLVSGALPAGMTFSNGIVSGTPTATGTYTFAIRLTNEDGQYAQRTYTLIVFGITNETPLEELVLGETYLVNFATSSGDPELQQWVVLAGNLPGGLTLEENGILHGTPTETGEFPITVRVLDSTTGFEPVSCMKDFTFNSLTPSFYWNYEDVTSMLDEIENVEMLATSAVSATGIIGDAFNFTASLNLTKTLQASDKTEFGYIAGQDWSASFWVNITGDFAANDAAILFSFENSLNDNDLRVEVVTGGGTIRVTADSTSGGTDQASAAFASDVGSWHFYTLVYESGILSLYQDGVLVVATSSAVVLETTASGTMGSLWIGNTGPTTLAYRFDELAVFMNKALNQEEIDFLYNSGVGRTWPW